MRVKSCNIVYFSNFFVKILSFLRFFLIFLLTFFDFSKILGTFFDFFDFFWILAQSYGFTYSFDFIITVYSLFV